MTLVSTCLIKWRAPNLHSELFAYAHPNFGTDVRRNSGDTISCFSGGKADTLALEPVNTRPPGPPVNSRAECPSVVLERTKAGERDERFGLRQSAEQANKAALHPAEGSSELRSHFRARGNDNRDETPAQEEETPG